MNGCEIPIQIEQKLIDRALAEESFIAVTAWLDPRTNIVRAIIGCVEPGIALDLQRQANFTERSEGHES